jgi:hypothetical protein
MKREVKTITFRWIQKAENDFKIGVDEMETNDPVADMICFHMQQCVKNI